VRLVIIATILGLATSVPPTLMTQLSIRGLPAPLGAEDLNREITSFDVLDDPRVFVIAYYTVERDGFLPDEVRIRVFDKRTRRWRYAVHDGIGSVLRIARTGDFLYVSGHASPSAAPTLVLNQQLGVERTLDGWIMLVLADGRLIFQRSMVHFQPTHAGVLAIYDPRTNAERTFYPAAPSNNDRGFERVARDRALERSISDVEWSRPHHVRFTVTVQTMDVSTERARPADLEQRRRVTCDVAKLVPTCVERADAGKD
jgi:hypothetical protein